MQVIIRHDVSLVATRLEPGHRNSNIFGRVAPGPLGQLINDGNNRVSGVEHVINDEHTVVVAYFFDDVIQAMHGDCAALVHTDIRRRSDGNVI